VVVWIEPIFDRTEEDVEFAREQISRWIAEELFLIAKNYLRRCKGGSNYIESTNRGES